MCNLIYMPTINQMATEVIDELGITGSPTQSAIILWFRTNYGKLNNAIGKNYAVYDDGASPPVTYYLKETLLDDTLLEIGYDEAAILKKFYYLQYYDSKIRENVGAAAMDAVVEVNSDGMKVRKVSKTEVGRNLVSYKKMELEELNSMISRYQVAKSNPRQVAGDDTVVGYYIGKNYPLGINS